LAQSPRHMSSYLWKAYYEDDVETFRRLLAEATVYNTRASMGRGSNATAVIGSPPALGTSPMYGNKTRKGAPATPYGVSLTKADINWRDSAGLTLLHHAASSTAANAIPFATALIEHPFIDLYVQDVENGWTALHRAFYFGNINIARLMLERDAGDALGRTTGHVQQTIGLIKIKDKEGHGPLDLYASTLKDPSLRPETVSRQRSNSTGSDDDRPNLSGDAEDSQSVAQIHCLDVNGDQLFNFGNNKNVTLGFGDQDDRQFPERVHLRRPEHLIRRFYQEHLEADEKKWSSHDPHYQAKPAVPSSGWLDDLPFVVRSKPLIIQDVHMAKLSSAVITADLEANLYMCGHGQGGRLGTGDEQTRFNFVCIEGGALAGKRIANVALGQNHTLALSDEGDIFTWGNNGFGQLGYSLPKTTLKDEDPISTVPRQIFGILKRETVVGVAATRIHSVAYTSTSLFTFGKNEGQLGIMDSDARSLEIQNTPRKVAASQIACSIQAVAAIDKATVCLLENREVLVFANYGYTKVQFPLDGFQNYFIKQSFLVTTYDNAPNRVVKLTGCGDTICAMSGRGEIYTFSISQLSDSQASASTTNPAKIRGAITTPQCIWSPKKSNMAARDVGVDADGSIILSTEEGSVWKRTKRTKIKDPTASGTGEYKPKDYKFSRIPGLTRVLAVRASGHGAYSAIRRDCDVLKTQVVVEEPTLWKDLFSILSLKKLLDGQATKDDDTRPRFWQSSQKPDEVQLLKHAILNHKDVEADLADLAERCFTDPTVKYDALVATTTSDVAIPVHRFLLTGRSHVLRRGFRDLCATSTFTLPDLAVSELDKDGRLVLKFQGLDILTVVDFVLYLYTDKLVDFWHMTRNAPKMAYRYRQIRTELMKVASKLELVKLEPAVRQMIMPKPCLDLDMEIAYKDSAFFYHGDVVVQLEDGEMRAHSTLLCVRCPFFEGLFMGRAGGRWLADRDVEEEIPVDLSHMSSKTFELVLRHIYADTGAELFDDLVCVGVDDFLDSIMDVMSASNELMIDRLSQICQEVVGRYVNVRNVCELLNAISPSSVHEFKDAALEYLCLNLEAMLQGHHLNALEEDLLLELDEVVRQNQLNCMPFAKSGRAESLLHERHPELAALIDRNRQRRIDGVIIRSKHHSVEAFMPGSLGDEMAPSPVQQKTRRRSSAAVARASEIDRPALKAKASTKEMMFAMDEEGMSDVGTPEQSPAIRPMTSPRGLEPIASSPPEETWYDSRGKVLPSPKLGPQAQPSTSGAATPRTPKSPYAGGKTPPNAGLPWNLTPLPGPKTDMRDIMAQTSAGRTSSLSQGLAAARTMVPATPSSFSLGAPKLSQKERKRMQQSQQSPAQASGTVAGSSASATGKPSNPWTSVVPQRSALKDILNSQSPPVPAKPSNNRVSSTLQLTMRQTVANAKQVQSPKPVIGPAGPSTLQQRSVSDSKALQQPDAAKPISKPGPQPPQQSNSKPIPQSIRHQPAPEPVLGLSMSEIVALEQAAKDEIKAATAKRDLQEIQAEQEFQEWWDKESARVQEAERRSAAAAARTSKKRSGGRGGGVKVGKSSKSGGSGSSNPGQSKASA
jgi:inhibitor of Bruton tyrosine kinase